MYLEQAQTRHTTVATAIADSTTLVRSSAVSITVPARWKVNGAEHTDVIEWDHAVKRDDPLDIWVDNAGKQTDPPTPTSTAGIDAVCVAVVT